MPGSENCPSVFETALETTPVPACFAATSAPGITAPDPSTTVPEMVWVWANAEDAKTAANRTRSPNRNTLRFIE